MSLKVVKTSLLLEQTHTDGYGAKDELGKLQVQFQAVAVNTEEDLLLDGETYFITAGADFAEGEYIWVAQAETATSLIGQVGLEREDLS